MAMTGIPQWWAKGDWFDVCKCHIPCSCEFAQPPNDEEICEGVLAWHVREGRYGDVVLDGLNVLAVGAFEGNVWAGAKAIIGIFLDERADEAQRGALGAIFGGQAGGWPAEFAGIIGELRGIEFAPIEFEVADDLAWWRAEVPGRVGARAEALAGPTTLSGQRVQTVNPPGSEVGPNAVATWGTATVNRVDTYDFNWEWAGRSSKHIPFDWSGPG